VRIGVSLPVFTADPSRPLAAADRAADAGFDGVFVPDHLFPPVFYPPSGPGRPALEAFGVLAAVAARRPELRVGTLVARVTLRPPGILAKQAAALACLSHAGAILALGTGDGASRPEHETFGIELPSAADRVGMLEETVLALGALFRGESYEGGDQVPPLDGPLLPAASPERWVGGRSDAVLAVAARSADAWNGWGLDVAGFASAAERLRVLADGRHVPPTWGGIALVGQDRSELGRLVAEREAAGRSLDGVWTGTSSDLRAFVDALEARGATWFIVLPVGPEDRIDVIAEALRR
jgi:alkanesulfonate monooxygenase SsuD/methylene tetrahydromethanopterin reductase-like flavin-dependent oxidoreductase (luciferase family)